MPIFMSQRAEYHNEARAVQTALLFSCTQVQLNTWGLKVVFREDYGCMRQKLLCSENVSMLRDNWAS